MKLNYKHLIFDYDDTLVKSVEKIHYPAYIEIMKKLRPEHPVLSLKDWHLMLHNVGIMNYYRELEFTKDELKEENRIWRNYTETILPDFIPGIIDVLKRIKKLGGGFSIVSHSEKDIIKMNFERLDVQPDEIYGWSYDVKIRKPSPWAVSQIMKKFNLEKKEMLIVGDSSADLQLSRNSGVKIVGVGWSHNIPEIRKVMKKECDFFCETVDELKKIIFS